MLLQLKTRECNISSLTVTDSLTDANGVSLVMGNGPYFSGANQGSGLGTLLREKQQPIEHTSLLQKRRS